jgi:hypothetical protein
MSNAIGVRNLSGNRQGKKIAAALMSGRHEKIGYTLI